CRRPPARSTIRGASGTARQLGEAAGLALGATGPALAAGLALGVVLVLGAADTLGAAEAPGDGLVRELGVGHRGSRLVRPPHWFQNALIFASSNVSSGRTRPPRMSRNRRSICSERAMTG